MNIFNNIGLGIVAVGTVIAGWFGYVPVENQVRFGASTQSSEVRALFTTTLASKITSSATSMTLSSATDKDGTVLASSTYGFIIDEGTSKEELVLADCTGTTCTNMTRGLSVKTGTTTVAALQFEHGRGAEVKITDAPALIYASNVFRGKQNLEYKLKYDSAQTFSDGNDIISRSYADSLAFGAVPAANETTSGFVELATGVETASSTSLGGTGARLAIPASLATSTYNSATAGLKVVVTQNDGKINNYFIATSTLFADSGTGGLTLATTTSVQTFTTVGANTWTKPTGAKAVKVILIGGGGRGCDSVSYAGAGGGGGGYISKILEASTISSTVTVTVGGSDQDTTFGSYLAAGHGFTCVGQANRTGPGGKGFGPGSLGNTADAFVSGTDAVSGGASGATSYIGGAGSGYSGGNGYLAGAAGGGSGANISGSGGAGGASYATSTTGISGGAGGGVGLAGADAPDVPVGQPIPGAGGGGGGAANPGAGGNGGTGGLYGGGGGGAGNGGSSDGTGGDGAQGIAQIITFF